MLRVSLAAAILDGGPHGLRPAVPPAVCLALAAQSLLLCAGFMTPVMSVLACVFDLVSLLIAAQADVRFTLLSGLNAASIALLGPGAYSLDARLFGRRVIVFHPGGRPHRP